MGSGGGSFTMDTCSAPNEVSDGRNVFSLTPKGQLKMPKLGNYCLTVASSQVVVQDCEYAEGSTDARDKFFMVSVPDFDASSVSVAKENSVLIGAAQEHLGQLLAKLNQAMPSLAACGF